ncbi:hypothetical protein LCGC14_2090640, partial [marine sediment metagenome]
MWLGLSWFSYFVSTPRRIAIWSRADSRPGSDT